MKKFLKITGITVAVIFLILLVAPFLFQGKIIEVVKTETNKMLNAKVDFSDLSLSFIRNFPNASVTIDDFTVVGVNEFEGDTLAAFDRLRVVVDIKSLFGDQIVVNRILLKKPKIYAKVLADGKANWDIMKPDTVAVETPEDTTTSAFALQLKDLTIENGYLVYEDLQGNMKALVDNLNFSLSGDMTQDITTLKTLTDIEKINFLMDNTAYLKDAKFDAKIDVQADLKNMKFTLTENELQLNDIKLNLDGWVAMLENGFDMDLKLGTPQTSFKSLLSMIPAIYAKDFETIQTKGDLKLDAWAKGVMVDSLYPAFNVKLGVANAWFKYPDLPKSVDNINIDAEVSNPGGILDLTTVNVRKFHFEIAKNPFDIRFLGKTFMSDLQFESGAKGTLNLDDVKEIYPLEDMTVSGVLKADAEAAGRMSQIEKEQYEAIKAKGDLTLSNFTYTTSDLPPVKITTAHLNFTPKYANLSNLDMKMGNSDFQANGKLENYIAYILKDETLKGELNLTSTLINVNDFTGEDDAAAPAQQETAKPAETTAASTDTAAIEVPKNISFKLNANIKKVTFDNIVLDNVKGIIRTENGKLSFNNIAMNAFGGAMNADGFYSTEDPTNPNVDMKLKISDVLYTEIYKQMDMVKQLAPIFENMSGKFSLDFDFVSQLDNTMSPVYNSINGNGVLTSKDLSVSNLKALDALSGALKNDKLKTLSAKDVKIKFTVKDGRVATEPFDIKTPYADLQVSGSTGLDQTIDYKTDIVLPQSLLNGVKLPENVKDIKMKVTANIGGTFTKPTVKLGAAETLGNLKDLAKEELKSKVNEGIDKLLAEAQKQKAALISVAQKQGDNLRSLAQQQGDNLVAEAKKQSDALVAKASNPIAKVAAQKSGEALVKEAQKKANDLNKEADNQANKLINSANEQGDKLIKEAEKKKM
ncbi:MAG: AsmA family protein [Prevotellaceae bacterium]|jgi:uncharacterized protein involved in outer membrane biogenesis|nr:AsmA family protein [Prevotellaceae bacterium]